MTNPYGIGKPFYAVYEIRPLHNSLETPSCAFWGTHLDEVNGPRQWVNPALFEAIRPSLQDLVSKSVDGSKSSCNSVRRGYAKVSR
jgi:hypothetical protein